MCSLQSGPKFQSGGDEANPCEFSFTWETPGACPVRPAHSSTCSVRDPESGQLYDLSPLAQLQNHFNVSRDGKPSSMYGFTCTSVALHGNTGHE